MINKTILQKNYFINSGWLQLVVKCRSNQIDATTLLFSGFLEDLKKEKKIKNWFFLNKNKKILFKIEFAKTNINYLLLANNLVKNIPEASVSLAVFDPEIYQFGGDIGWHLAKKYFNKIAVIISNLKLDYDNKKELAMIVVFDLFLRVCGDSWEAWDAFQRLMLIRNVKKIDLTSVTTILKTSLSKKSLDLMKDPKKLYFNDNNKPFMANFILANTSLASEFKINELNLLFPLRKILPYYAVFIFNMFHLAEKDQKDIIKLLSIRLNPVKY
jgi:hypothetical protein